MAWSLHRDLGFPLDLVDLMLEERGFRVDHQELDTLISESKVCNLWHQVHHGKLDLLSSLS